MVELGKWDHELDIFWFKLYSGIFHLYAGDQYYRGGLLYHELETGAFTLYLRVFLLYHDDQHYTGSGGRPTLWWQKNPGSWIKGCLMSIFYYNTLRLFLAVPDTTDERLCSTHFKFTVTPKMAPLSRLLVYYVRENGEGVADATTLNIEPSFENKVGLFNLILYVCLVFFFWPRRVILNTL